MQPDASQNDTPIKAALHRLRVNVLWLRRHGLLQVGGAFFGLILACAAVFAWLLPAAAFSRPIQGYGDALYFSVVTVTTLGYGDISPISGWAKAVSASEALLGYILAGTLLYRLSLAYSAREATRHRERFRRLTRRFRKEVMAMTRSALSYLYPQLDDEGMNTGDVPDDPRRLTKKIEADPNFAPDDVYEHFFQVMRKATDRERLLGSLHRLEDLMADQPYFVEMAAMVETVEYTELTEGCLATIENLERFLESDELQSIRADAEKNRAIGHADSGERAANADVAEPDTATDAEDEDEIQRLRHWQIDSIKQTVRPAFRSLAVLYEELQAIEMRESDPVATP